MFFFFAGDAEQTWIFESGKTFYQYKIYYILDLYELNHRIKFPQNVILDFKFR